MNKPDNKRFVLITPTYNEALNIEKCIRTVFNSFPKNPEYDFHVLVVDGSSPDGTANVVRKLIPEIPKLHLLVEKTKSGLGSAYLKGMKVAFYELNATHVFQFDADLSHDASKLKDFVAKIAEGYDLVLGTRYKAGGGIPANWGLHRKLLSKFGNLFVSLLFFPNTQISDWTGGYKCFNKKVYERVKDEISLQKGYTTMISFNKSAIDAKFKIAEVPFTFKERTQGKSKLGLDYFFNALYFVIKTRISDFFNNRFLKVCFVGAIGALIQTSLYLLLRKLNLAVFFSQNISIEFAVLSNFLINNFFSFRDRKISGGLGIYLKKFVVFNALSFGSILIQNIVMTLGLATFSSVNHVEIVLLILGILLGLIFNFTFYSKIIWRKKK